jgi:hypothetical protein
VNWQEKLWMGWIAVSSVVIVGLLVANLVSGIWDRGMAEGIRWCTEQVYGSNR